LCYLDAGDRKTAIDISQTLNFIDGAMARELHVVIGWPTQ